jgi:hypothetical protein
MPGVAYPKDKPKPSFSGTWVLNVQKSRFEDPHKPTASVLTILIRGPEFHLKQTTTLDNGKTDTATVDLLLDSKGVLVERYGRYERRSQVLQYAGSLGLFRQIVVMDGSAKGFDGTKYTLAENGEVLIAEEKNDTLDGQVFNNLWYFKRK